MGTGRYRPEHYSSARAAEACSAGLGMAAAVPEEGVELREVNTPEMSVAAQRR